MISPAIVQDVEVTPDRIIFRLHDGRVDEDIGVWELLGVPEDDVFEAAGLDIPVRR